MKHISELFKAFSEEVRLRILGMLIDGNEVCVCKFSEVLKSTHSKTSRHLTYLKRTNLVVSRRKGQWMYYKLNPKIDKDYAEFLDITKKIIQNSPIVKKDIKKLEELNKLENCHDIKNKKTI